MSQAMMALAVGALPLAAILSQSQTIETAGDALVVVVICVMAVVEVEFLFWVFLVPRFAQRPTSPGFGRDGRILEGSEDGEEGRNSDAGVDRSHIGSKPGRATPEGSNA